MAHIRASLADPALTRGETWLAEPETRGWADSQTNAALRTHADVRIAEALLREAGLPRYPDAPKNWDTMLALYHALACGALQGRVLDAGTERCSMFLPALRRLGAADLTGINPAFREPEQVDGIEYCHGDITAATEFPDGGFDFIACLRVIEDAVNTDKFLQEAARLLRPGGHLFVSFDYWHEAVETPGQHAYGMPIRIVTRDDVMGMLCAAEAFGLVAEQPCDLRCVDRVVHWQQFDLRYTFANFLLRKGG